MGRSTHPWLNRARLSRGRDRRVGSVLGRPIRSRSPGKGIGGATADRQKPAKKYRKDTKALADLSKPAKHLGSTAMEASTLEQKSSQQGTKTTKKAQMSNIFADDETNKCFDEIELFHLESNIEAKKQILGKDIKMLIRDIKMPEPEPEIDPSWLDPEIVSPLLTPPPSDH
ncbi:hypothetical protein Taro_017142 [Colocasia esculenta]|uniref:Uncharacterized protein n=1 Tax=Colocasia esculenta TaxID=4460 RepID=A0A843USC2_COLES|nr:hypothetical protein [Colocasia esculenta]